MLEGMTKHDMPLTAQDVVRKRHRELPLGMKSGYGHGFWCFTQPCLLRYIYAMDTMANVVRALAAAGADSSLVGQTVLALVNSGCPPELAPLTHLTPAAPPLPRDLERFKQVTYTDAEGNRSTIGVPRALFTEAAALLGGDKPASKWLRAKAIAAPLNVRNRSGWVQDRLTEHLFAMRPKTPI